MSSPSIVRKAVPEDEAGIWKLFHEMHEESGAFPISYPKVQHLLDRILHPELIPADDFGVRGYMGVIGPVGEAEALILLVIGSYWYSDAWIIEEFVNFVSKEHRKSEHAVTLLKYAKHISDKLDVPLLIGVLSSYRTEAKVRLYKRQFGEPSGAFYFYNAKLGSSEAAA